MNDTNSARGAAGETDIDENDPVSVEHWARTLDATPMQIREALAQVGAKAADVEMHLKGTHATTNAERAKRA